jgi:membrane-associated protease RseP (regulator of RpoE activity)
MRPRKISKAMRDENGEARMRAENLDTVNCPSCGATLVAGLRFCRMCGYRLGEGVEEYVATQLLDPAAPPRPTASKATDPFAARQTWGAAPLQPVGTAPLKKSGDTSAWSWAGACNPKRGGWLMWMILVIVLLTAAGVVTKSVRDRIGGGPKQAAMLPSNSIMAEVDGFTTADGGGAFIDGLAGPDTSLERAGILGGDIITVFDGQPVRDAGAMRRILAGIPPGKSVQVTYIHDGETKMTTLTTADRRDFRGMTPVDSRPGGRGVLGIDPGDRVRVPSSNIYGVELDGVDRNGPADLAGLKKGDLITDFGGKPVRTPGDLRLRIYEAMPSSTVPVVVMRDGQRLEIPVKMGRQRG